MQTSGLEVTNIMDTVHMVHLLFISDEKTLQYNGDCLLEYYVRKQAKHQVSNDHNKPVCVRHFVLTLKPLKHAIYSHGHRRTHMYDYYTKIKC